MTGSTKQSISPRKESIDCFVAYAPRNDGFLILNICPQSRGAMRPTAARNECATVEKKERCHFSMATLWYCLDSINSLARQSAVRRSGSVE
jgi:hypothetical protein